jgi:hypothetical protein
MAGEQMDEQHQLVEAQAFVAAFRKLGRGFVLQSEQILELLHITQVSFQLELERHR